MYDEEKTKEQLITELQEMRRKAAELENRLADFGQVDEKLVKSEQRYRKLIESVTDYIYTVKVENGCVVSTSHGLGCVAVTGYASEEYNSDPYLWYRMIYDEDKKAVIEQAEKVISGKAVSPLEHRIVHKNGNIRWVKNTPVPRFDEKGNLIAYDALIADITERKRLEEQLSHVQKMEAIGHLAGGIAHDFNNILTAIIGYGHVLMIKMDGTDPLRHNAAEILKSAERAANLTQGLLAFSRKQIISPRPMKLNEIIRNVEKLLLRIIGEDIELKAELAADDSTVMADSVQMEQVLMNLATNARDAMPEGGFLTIKTEKVEFDREYISAHGYGEAGAYVCISVTDTGSGMDEETKKKIFEPFFTTKDVGKGTGLGLAIIYGIIKQHNGYINVYSEPGRGTTFKIYLPLSDISPDELKKEDVFLPRGKSETVLLAEDDGNVRNLIRVVLGEYGYQVIEAVDGEDAVRKFIDNKDRVDLLVLDVIMPKKNGKEVYDEISGMAPGKKALFISGYTADIIHKKGILESGVHFISKPIAPQDFLRKVREILDA